ncbi:MAG: arsenate reductase (glutaredoxin) [Flavobacteriaceae bacterium]
MQNILYHNNRCRKSREALDYLREKGLEPTVIEYLKTPLTASQWQEVFTSIGKKPSEMVRTQEALWKENYKGKKISEIALLDILTDHPKLIERPIYQQNNRGVLARPIENLIDFLKKSQTD